ncbi:MAG: DUF1080 domain-containing protein [Pirellulales bacterium]
MIRQFLVVAVVSLLALPAAIAEPATAEPVTGWRTLFNGQDLTGWSGDPKLWSVREGVIRGETTPDARANGNTFLIAEDLLLENFELELSFRCSATNNSGIQYRSKHITEGNPKNAWVVRGYQHEIRNENKFPNVSGFIYDEGGKRGRICPAGERAVWTDKGKEVTGQLIDEAGFAELFRLDDWNDVRIVAEGNRLRHFMNGTLILDFTDDDTHVLREGILAVQLHAGAPMWAEYRGIRVRGLPAAE